MSPIPFYLGNNLVKLAINSLSKTQKNFETLMQTVQIKINSKIEENKQILEIFTLKIKRKKSRFDNLDGLFLSIICDLFAFRNTCSFMDYIYIRDGNIRINTELENLSSDKLMSYFLIPFYECFKVSKTILKFHDNYLIFEENSIEIEQKFNDLKKMKNDFFENGKIQIFVANESFRYLFICLYYLLNYEMEKNLLFKKYLHKLFGNSLEKFQFLRKKHTNNKISLTFDFPIEMIRANSEFIDISDETED